MGTGKTTELMYRLLQHLRMMTDTMVAKVVLVLPTRAIARKAKEGLIRHVENNDYKIKIGHMIGRSKNPGDIEVVTIGHAHKVPGLLVFDEAHMATPFSIGNLMDLSVITRSVFMSATSKNAFTEYHKDIIRYETLKTNKKYSLIVHHVPTERRRYQSLNIPHKCIIFGAHNDPTAMRVDVEG